MEHESLERLTPCAAARFRRRLRITPRGALYQRLSVWRESNRFPAPGRLITVLGPGERSPRQLHLVCLGQGQPTVIFEHSGFGNALSSRALREEVSAYTRADIRT